MAVNLWCDLELETRIEIEIKYGHISLWNTSLITDMSGLFSGKRKFDENINNWDVSNVRSMCGMFTECSYNQPLNNWDVSNVTNMCVMFRLFLYPTFK